MDKVDSYIVFARSITDPQLQENTCWVPIELTAMLLLSSTHHLQTRRKNRRPHRLQLHSDAWYLSSILDKSIHHRDRSRQHHSKLPIRSCSRSNHKWLPHWHWKKSHFLVQREKCDAIAVIREWIEIKINVLAGPFFSTSN